MPEISSFPLFDLLNSRMYNYQIHQFTSSPFSRFLSLFPVIIPMNALLLHVEGRAGEVGNYYQFLCRHHLRDKWAIEPQATSETWKLYNCLIQYVQELFMARHAWLNQFPWELRFMKCAIDSLHFLKSAIWLHWQSHHGSWQTNNSCAVL